MEKENKYIKEFEEILNLESWTEGYMYRGIKRDYSYTVREIRKFIKKVLKSQKKGKVVWLEVTDYAEALRVCGEYSKKEPKNPIYKYKKFRINLIKEDE